jgi:hypothetical protein
MSVDPLELRALADELLTRDFLPDECARYAPTTAAADRNRYRVKRTLGDVPAPLMHRVDEALRLHLSL